MPLRILKRNSKQYNVVSKSTFVLSVELLDNGVMECTLDADSTGRDCLLNISQRLGLHQPDFFGLRYISRGVPPRQRWVELDRPLRKQLDKNAQDSQLSLGVMFYVNDVNLLKDEMARYHYFLQLKSDVIDGKLNCSIEQAISLAAYSLQEFGDFDPERHTIEYLRDFAILPKELITEQKYSQVNVEGLYEAVVRQYASLIGFPPPLAEIYYIMVAQQLDGYGQEPYAAKDDAGNEILICVSVNGILIRRRDWTHIAAFRWMDIKSLMGHKRLFVIESSQSHRTMQYHFTDAETAKYVHKICLLQSTFYKEKVHSSEVSSSSLEQQQQYNPSINRNQQHHGFVPQQNANVNFPSASMGNINRNYNHQIDSGEIASSGSYFPGVTPDLLTPTLGPPNNMPHPNPALARLGCSSNLLLSNSISSTFSQSGMSLNSSTTTMGAGYGGSKINFGQPTFSTPMHQMVAFSHPIQRQPEIESLMFHSHPNEAYTQMGVVRTNPLALMPMDASDQDHYSNGYGRAVSDYTAALQEKYGSMIPDLSVKSNSPSMYLRQVAERNINQQQGFSSSIEEEPIYQNEVISQVHSMEMKNSKPDSNENLKSSEQDLEENVTEEDTTVESAFGNNFESQQQQYCSNNQNSDRVEWRSRMEEMHNLQQQLQTSASNSSLQHSQQSMEELPLYVFKSPPPYPGPMKDLGSGTNSSKADVLSESFTNEQSGVSVSSNSSGGEITLRGVRLPPTVTASVVSAEVYQEPHDDGDTAEEGDVMIDRISQSINATHIQEEMTMHESKTVKHTMSPSVSGQEIMIVSNNKQSVEDNITTSGLTSDVDIQTKREAKEEAKTKQRTNKEGLFGKPIDASILNEYHSIPRAKELHSFTVAVLPENFKRNRFPEFLPYDDNSAHLSPSRHNPLGYINASPVSGRVGDRQWLYMVTQLPLVHDIPALWQLIWESDVKVLVSLDRDSSSPYYPSNKGVSMTFNEFQIAETKGERRNSANNAPTIAREFTVNYLPKKKQKKLLILPYEEEWREDVPIHTEHFLCFLEEVNSIQRKMSDPGTPLAVLCGTGAGRSGVFILSDLLLHAADSGHKLRCDSLLRDLRLQRSALVSSPSQYAFVLHTLAKYLAQSRLI